MSLTKPKFNLKQLDIATRLVVIIALISQVIVPVVVKADTPQNMANSTQKIVSLELKDQSVSQTSKVSVADEDQPDKVIRAVITAYTSTPNQTDDSPFIAATGKRVHDGMIAANGLPFGTKIKIPSLYGDKIFVVEDRMNSRYGFGRMDIWLDTSQAQAMKFGVKRVEVQIFYPDTAVAKAK